jgi:hypothetical protein
MNTTTIQVYDAITELLAPFDAKLVEDTKAWAVRTIAALREFKATEEYTELAKKGAWSLYPKLFSIAGGKTWFNVFGTGEKFTLEFVEKNCKAVATKRNAKIASKLTQAGVTEVIDTEIAHSHSGFDGFYRVRTEQGEKRVTIRTIYAGGYNIQCAHLRVLVNVK